MINQPLPEARDAGAARAAPAFALSLPVWRDRLWIALGYRQALRHGSRYLPPDSDALEDATRYLGRSLAIVDHRVVLGAALRVGSLRVGVALEGGYARLSHERTLWLGLADDAARLERPEHDSNAKLELAGASFAARLGLGWRPLRWLRLALEFALPGVRRLAGDVALSTPLAPPTGFSAIEARGGRAHLDLDPPAGTTGGVAVQPCEHLVAAFAVRWRNWSALGAPRARVEGARYRLSGAAPRDVAPSSIGLGVTLRDAISLHAGLELRLLARFLRVRFGYGYQRGMTPPASPGSLVVDPPRHTIAGGFELRARSLTLAASLAHSFGVQLDSVGDGTTFENPLDGTLTRPIGRGVYEASSTRVVLELKIKM